ncbi:MAG: MFS transporter [Planctomycetes bacterium]|nr:MFS transporter [Planctomycetota bacterium]
MPRALFTLAVLCAINALNFFDRQILRIKTLWWIILSGAVHNFNMYAMGSFIASLFIRYHGESLARAGQICGLVLGPAGALGMYLVGFLGDRAYRKGVRSRLQVAWLVAALAVPFFLLALQVPEKSTWRFTGWLLPAVMLLYAYYGTVYAAIQDVVEPRRRGTAMAVYFCAMYLLGGLFGPVATGWLSDRFAARAAARAGFTLELSASGSPMAPEAFRAAGLHQAFYMVPVLCAVLALVLLAASRTVMADHERLQATPG